MQSFPRSIALLVAYVAITVIPLLGNAYLFDWDEVNFAECAREMIITGNYRHPQIDFEPFWEKPPLFFWLQAATMHMFGINEFAARFPNALVGIATVVLVALVGRRWVDDTFGLLWALLWIGSLLPQFYMHSGLIDPLFNFLMITATVSVLESNRARYRYLLLSIGGLLLGLAVLTKGPVAVILVGVPLVLFWVRRYGIPRLLVDGGMVMLLSLTPFALWLFSDHSHYGQWFMQSFIEYQVRLLTTGDAGHSGPIYYHLIVLLIGCFPASWLAIAALRPSRRITLLAEQSSVFLFMLATVVFVFSLVQTKIVHYSSLAYYPLTFFGAQALYHWWQLPERNKLVIAIALGALMIGAAMITTPFVLGDRLLLLSLVHNQFTRSIIEATTPHWRGIEWSAGALVALSAISFFVLRRLLPRAGIVVLLLGIGLGVSAFLRVVAPRIQDFTERQLVEFCRRYSNRDVILHPIGFKTYIHLFYGKRRYEHSPRGNGIPRSDWESYLLDGPIRRDVVFIAKRTKAEDLLRRRDFVQLNDPNSPWLFLLRQRTP